MTAFLRMGDPVIVSVAPTAQVVASPVPPNANTARVSNPNKFDVRFRGSSGATDLVTASTGVRLAAGAVEVFSTQQPPLPYITTLAIDSQITGTPAGTGTIELLWGTGE